MKRAFVMLAMLGLLAAACGDDSGGITIPADTLVLPDSEGFEIPTTTTEPLPDPVTVEVGATGTTPLGSEVTVYSYQQPITIQYVNPSDGFEYASVDVEECVPNEPKPPSYEGASDGGNWEVYPDFFQIHMPDNTRYEAEYGVREPYYEGDLLPGECIRGFVSFEVPVGQRPDAVLYSDNLLGGATDITFEL